MRVDLIRAHRPDPVEQAWRVARMARILGHYWRRIAFQSMRCRDGELSAAVIGLVLRIAAAHPVDAPSALSWFCTVSVVTETHQLDRAGRPPALDHCH